MYKLKNYRIDISVKNYIHIKAKSNKEARIKGAETLNSSALFLDYDDLKATEIKGK